jgi:Zn-dependent metalloprotease
VNETAPETATKVTVRVDTDQLSVETTVSYATPPDANFDILVKAATEGVRHALDSLAEEGL